MCKAVFLLVFLYEAAWFAYSLTWFSTVGPCFPRVLHEFCTIWTKTGLSCAQFSFEGLLFLYDFFVVLGVLTSAYYYNYKFFIYIYFKYLSMDMCINFWFYLYDSLAKKI